MVVVVPVSLLGQTPSAILHTQGGVWVNNYEATDSSTIFSGDTLETKPGFSSNLVLEGSAVLIQPESVGTFKGDLLELDHGGVSVETSRSFKVRVHCITVTPVSSDFTQYDVSDVNGTVQVAARKKDVNVEIEGHHKPSVENAGTQGGSVRGGSVQGGSVHEGEQHSYNESQVCGAPPRTPETKGIPAKWLEIGGAGVAGGTLLICVLLPCWGGGGPKNSISPTAP